MASIRRLLGGLAAGVSGFALALAPIGAPTAASLASPSLEVRTDKGIVRGVRADGVDSFVGIRYAAPPVGAMRWQPPQPAAPWSGVKAADGHGNRCPATASSNGPRSETEDCLFINVQRPAGVDSGARRPVFVFIHGGGLVNGSSNQVDMRQLVAATGIVGVTMNYRLGALGFLGIPGLTAQGGQGGNYGMLDQQAALRWAQRNIAAFGGDPRQVTLGGESSGGWSVCAHLVAPGSAGLFARAVIQSGSCPSQTQAQSAALGTSVAKRVGCTVEASAVACLRTTPVGKLIDAGYPGLPAPVRGTSFLPLDPRLAIATGQFARVPVVIGANRDDGRTFSQGNIGWTKDHYLAWVNQSFGADAAAVLAHYPWPATSDKFTAAYLSGAIITDAGLVYGFGGCRNRKLTQDFARYVHTWAYEFDSRAGPGLRPVLGYQWGSGHAAELAYLFPSFDNGTPIASTFNQAERQLAGDIKQYWGAFVLHRTPQVPGQAAWPGYDSQPLLLSLRAGHGSGVISDATLQAEHQCSFWDSRS